MMHHRVYYVLDIKGVLLMTMASQQLNTKVLRKRIVLSFMNAVEPCRSKSLPGRIVLTFWYVYSWLSVHIHQEPLYSFSTDTGFNFSIQDISYDDVIKWKHFPVAGSLWGETTGHQWIPLTKASEAEFLCFFW